VLFSPVLKLGRRGLVEQVSAGGRGDVAVVQPASQRPRCVAAARVILRTCRELNRLSQNNWRSASLRQDYISMIETRRANHQQVSTLRHIAHTLAIPVHVSAPANPTTPPYLAMIQFADSILNLAEIARQAAGQPTRRRTVAVGGPLEARASEGWPTGTRCPARPGRGALAGRAGDRAREQRLSSAARWTARLSGVSRRPSRAGPARAGRPALRWPGLPTGTNGHSSPTASAARPAWRRSRQVQDRVGELDHG